ncbi:MAG: helix-turn-helix domain-containing protein [Bacteroidales bacterium]|jgi:AraC-like DNA-binding protein|nr:helix-turn-helix domain-containing protein [Bacteroidales bacterium]
MHLHYAAPNAQLAPYIKRYWAIENVLAEGETCVQRIIPTGMPELSLYFSPRPKILTGGKQFPANVSLQGLQTGFYTIELRRELSVFTVVFQPQGLMPFFRFPQSAICNQLVSFADVAGQVGCDLEEEMSAAVDFQQRVQVVESYFSALLKSSCADVNFSRISHTISIIIHSRAAVDIAQMASEACLSRKQFERIFAAHIGISPKQYLKIIRFQWALLHKQHNTSLSMTELAYAAGYADQSHLTHDFQSLCGQTPKHYFAENEICSDFFEEL